MHREHKENKHIVYRYIDVSDNIVKYVGITYKDNMKGRIYCHKTEDDWRDEGSWRIEYFECANKSEAEAFESHLIALYGTDKYYNKHKSGWGINQYLPNVEDKWKKWEDARFTDAETAKAAKLMRRLIRSGYIKEAMSLLDCFEFEDNIKNGTDRQTENRI
jgi:hypothetical protein